LGLFGLKVNNLATLDLRIFLKVSANLPQLGKNWEINQGKIWQSDK
jgi:hypothetical protein